MAIQSDDYKIITDDPAKDVPDFKEYAERLSQIIVVQNLNLQLEYLEDGEQEKLQ